MKTQKIAQACFIGGFIGTLALCSLHPALWWLGSLAGLAAGYLSYEFKETLAAVPVAWRRAQRGGRNFLDSLKTTPYVLWIGAVYATVFLGYIVHSYPTLGMSSERLLTDGELLFGLNAALLLFILAVLSIFGAYAFSMISFVCLFFFAEKKSLSSLAKWTENDPWAQIDSMNLEGWTNALTLHFLGTIVIPVAIIVALLSVVWMALRAVCVGIYFLGRFSKQFFILIHSQERLLCAVDSMLGALLTSIVLRSDISSPLMLMVIASCGGLLGALFGVLNWEIVSKRWLRIPAAQ